MARFAVSEAARLVAAARADAGLTQRELSERSGVSQPNLASIERGRRIPSAVLLERILKAAAYRPSIAVALHGDGIRRAARRRGLGHPRVFGSLLRGDDDFDSDIDLIVDGAGGLLGLAAFADEVEELTGFPADVYSESSANATEAGRAALREAVPV